MFKKLLFSLCLILFSYNAYANDIYIEQVGDGLDLDITQDGQNNEVGDSTADAVLNGDNMTFAITQTGNTNTMIFNVDIIVSYVSKFMSLQAGDIITTGTPPGVGMGKKPQVFLKAGDQMKLSIENLGEQSSKVVPI